MGRTRAKTNPTVGFKKLFSLCGCVYINFLSLYELVVDQMLIV